MEFSEEQRVLELPQPIIYALCLVLPACRRLLFPLLHACNKGNRRRLHAGNVWSKAKEFPGTKGTRNKVLRNKATERKKVTNKLQFNFIPRVLKGGNWLTFFDIRDTFECNHVNVIDNYPLTRRTISKNTTPLSVYFIFQAPSRYRRMCTYTVPSDGTSSRDHCSARLSV